MIALARRPRSSRLVPANWQDLTLSLQFHGGRDFGVNRLAGIVTDGSMFLELWEGEAKRLRWSALNLFGVHPVAPMSRYDVMGLVPVLAGGSVRQLSSDYAIIAAPTGSLLTYTKTPQPGAVLLWNIQP
jgi:hypothetical protein